MIQVAWLGHAAWSIDDGRYRLLVDPFLTGNPSASISAAEAQADFILVSHGHADHVGDTIEIAKRTGATVISNYEICQWLAGHGVERTIGHNLGGASVHPFGRVKLTLAFHSSVLPDGANGGGPSGFLISIGGKQLYFACDTALFGDMKLIGAAGIDLAVLPIGDLFTMGPDDALAAVKLLEPKKVAPCHYNTWPPIAQDAAAWAAKVKAETRAEPCVLAPGGVIKL